MSKGERGRVWRKGEGREEKRGINGNVEGKEGKIGELMGTGKGNEEKRGN